MICVCCFDVGGTPVQSTWTGRHWAGEGALAPWMNWKISPAPSTPVDAGLSLWAGAMSVITALLGAALEMRLMDGAAAAPHLYHRREGTRGTAIVTGSHPRAENMMIPSSTVHWSTRPGPGEVSEVLPGWMRTATLPQKAAPEERAATTAGHLATVQKRRTPCLHTLSGKQSGTAGLMATQSDIALQTLPGQSDTGPQSYKWGLSHTRALLRGHHTHCRGAERRETEIETWWVTYNRGTDFVVLHRKACK